MNGDVKKAVEAIGATAEMALVFYRATIGQGATPAEAVNLTQAYMAALFIQGKYGPTGTEGQT